MIIWLKEWGEGVRVTATLSMANVAPTCLTGWCDFSEYSWPYSDLSKSWSACCVTPPPPIHTATLIIRDRGYLWYTVQSAGQRYKHGRLKSRTYLFRPSQLVYVSSVQFGTVVVYITYEDVYNLAGHFYGTVKQIGCRGLIPKSFRHRVGTRRGLESDWTYASTYLIPGGRDLQPDFK